MEIHISKITDWMKENSSLAPDLESHRPKMRLLASEALHTSVEAGAKIDPKINAETYVACKIVLHQLEIAEGSQTKNMFGQYTVPHLQNWATVLSKWEEKNMHIADSQDFLFRSIFFKYPHLNRAIVATEKCIADITRRTNENDRNLHAFTKSAEDLLSEWDFDTANMDTVMTASDIATALRCRCDDLHEFNSQILCAIRDDTLREAMEYYFAFVHAQSPGLGGLGTLQRLQLLPVPLHRAPSHKSGGPFSSDSAERTSISATEARNTPSPLAPESSLQIMSTQAFRQHLIADLHELRAFSVGRLSALQKDTLSAAAEEGVVSCAVTKSPDQLRDCVEAVDAAICLVCDSKKSKLYLLVESDDLVTRISIQIETAMRKMNAVKNLCESSLRRQKELEIILEDLVLKKNDLKQLMRATREELEKLLSKLAGKEIRVVSENMPQF